MRSAVALGLLLCLGCATTQPTHGKVGWSPAWGGGSSGGLSTVHTSGVVSGDGSVSTPVTIADAAVTNAKLAHPLPSGSGPVIVTSGVASVGTVNVDIPGVQWINSRLAEAQAVDPTITRCRMQDMSDPSSGDLALDAATLTGTDVPVTTVEGGGTKMSSGTTANSSRNLRGRNGSNATAALRPVTVVSQKNSHYVWFARAKVNTTVDATTTLAFVADFDQAQSVDFWCGVVGSATNGTTNYACWVNGGGTTKTAFSTLIDTTSFHNFGILNDGSGNGLQLIYDGVLDATKVVVTNLATGPSGWDHRMFAANGAGAVNREAIVTYLAICTQ